VAFAGCIVAKRPDVPSAEATSYPLRVIALADGLHVVLEQAPDFDRAGAALVIGAGSAQEPASESGLAHLTEHIAFEGKHGGASLVELERSVGAQANAMTSWDATTYFAADAPGSLETIVRFLHGVATEPLAGTDAGTFEREWRAVANEMRMRTENGTPGQAIGMLMASTFPADHPYAHPVVATPESLSRITLEDVRDFAAAHYRPERCTLVVSAPLSFDLEQALVERATGQAVQTGSIKRAPQDRPGPPDHEPGSFQARDAEVPTPTLWIGWSVPSGFGDEADLAPLLAAALRGSFRISLAERDPDIASVHPDVLAGTAASIFYVEAALKEGAHPERTARLVAEEMSGALGNLATWDISLDTLARLAASHYVYDEENLVPRLLDLGWSYQHTGSPLYLRGLGERMRQRSFEDVRRYAQTRLGPERAHAVLLRPGASAARAPVMPPPRAPTPRPAAATGPVPSPAPLAGARAPLPAPDDQPRKLLATLRTHVLPNGLTLVLLPRPGSPFHTVLLGFRGGSAQASPPGVATATAWARQSPEMAPQAWGVDYHSRVEGSSTEEVLRSTSSDVRETLKHLRRMLGFSVFWPPRSFNKQVDVFEREDQAPPAALERALGHALYGSSPLGESPTAKQLQKITPSEVNRWVSKVRRPSNGALVIVGDFNPDDALAAARAEIGGWGLNAGQAPELAAPPLLEELAPDERGRVLFQHRPGAQQATVRFDCLLPKATADDYATQFIYATSVQRALHHQLRDEIGASYGPGTEIRVLAGGTATLDLSADVDYALLPEALARLRRLATRPGAAPLQDQPLERLRRVTAHHLRMGASTTPSMAAALFDLWSLGWPLDTLDRLPAQALAASAEAVAAVAEHCRDNWVVGLLGDERRLRAAWEASARGAQ
jgi:zinc protease